jgi:eukaryotic-like serine/threonine-protein kinase
MNQQAKHCDELSLERLLADDDAGCEADGMTDHLEHCPACQSRLAELAGDDSWWQEARESLSGGGEFAWAPDASWSSRLTSSEFVAAREASDSAVRKFLAPPSHPELLGRLGRYDVERAIGAGGMGIVLKAHDSELNRPVAVKVLASHLAHVGAARERFAREGRAAAAVVHEHVVAIYNVESDGEHPFLVMQFVPGRSLQARVDAEGPLAVEEILRIGMQAASGLAAAHAQGLVHRDVKPSNILLEESVERAVLTDFGLARTIDDASLTHTGVLAGTPHYMSPEQASGEAIDHRSDLFSLGAVLYFMATGHPPFRADGALAVLHRICREEHRPVWQTNKDVPDELSDLIDSLLEKKPGRRPASAAEVSTRLSALLSRFQQYGPARRRFGSLRGRRQRQRAVGVGIAALAGLIIMAAIFWIRGNSKPIADTPPAPVDRAAVAAQVQVEGQFSNELEQARQVIERSEREVFAPSSNDELWRQEVDVIERELSRIESQFGNSP